MEEYKEIKSLLFLYAFNRLSTQDSKKDMY